MFTAEMGDVILDVPRFAGDSMNAIASRCHVPMIRFSLPYALELGARLEAIALLPDTDLNYADVWLTVFNAESTVETMHQSSIFSPYLRSSSELARKLLSALAEIKYKASNVQHMFYSWEITSLKLAANNYKIAVLAELGSADTYFVTRKGGFDTMSLLLSGEVLFPLDLGQKVPEALYDTKEAAKCLAYDVPNACGFHLFRALEAVVRRYHAYVTGGSAPPKVRSLGVYIASLVKSGKGDPKIVATLKQMNDLHRNPLIHPEATLSNEEALTVLGVARSAVAAMLAVLPVPPATTTQPTPAML